MTRDQKIARILALTTEAAKLSAELAAEATGAQFVAPPPPAAAPPPPAAAPPPPVTHAAALPPPPPPRAPGMDAVLPYAAPAAQPPPPPAAQQPHSTGLTPEQLEAAIGAGNNPFGVGAPPPPPPKF